MSFDPFHELILSELKDLKTEIKEVRQTDIPALRVDVAGFNAKLKTLDKQQTRATQIYTILGGLLAVIASKITGHH